MAQDFGNGVSRTLSASERKFLQTVWQASKPPLDSELNLVAQISSEQLRESIQAEMHSGFFSDPMMAEADFVTNPNWSNWFKLGRPANENSVHPFVWANVNGWVIPVTGSGVPDGDPSNRVNLFGPPSTDSRIDLVFLEVWQAQVAPNPSATNKPSAANVYKYGNVNFGGTNIPDDIQDPTIGFETTERVQLQYRLRVVGKGTGLGDSIDLAQYPDGLDDPNVIAQGTQASPVAGYVFSNMGDTLGDRGLWRAGSGDLTSRTDLGTVDGYVYAIPVCAVFRRNSGLFVARKTSGNANQNGSFNRNPTSGSITDPLQATRTLTSVTLTSDLSADTTGLVSVTGLSGSGLDNVNILWSATVLQVGEEIFTVSSVDPGAGTITVDSRGRFGTQAAKHFAGAEVSFYTIRPDGRFADQITPNDILDLRRSVSASNWSYDSLLKHNLGKLLDGSLRSSYKQGNGSNTQGTQIIEVDSYVGLGAGTVPNQTEHLDGFDGIRTVFSDSSTVQNDVSLLVSPSSGSVTVSPNSWGVAADFDVDGFIPGSASTWENGSVIRLYIGGASGNAGARETSAFGDRFMRFVSPQEYWLSRDDLYAEGSGVHGNQTPFKMRFVGDPTTAPQAWSQSPGLGETLANHPGPMFPLPEHGFLFPYAVLGGVVNTDLASASATTSANEVAIPGVDFDLAGQWASDAANPQVLSTTGISNLLLHGERNLFDMLTAGGRDLTGNNSELFLVLSGNNTDFGLFRVVGAGTIGYTSQNASASGGLKVVPIGPASSMAGGQTVTAEVRSFHMNTEDNPGSTYAAACIVLTDVGATQGGSTNPWNGLSSSSMGGDMVVDTSILYGPSRGGMARLADSLSRFALVNPAGVDLISEAPENKDQEDSLDIRNRTGAESDEYFYSPQPLMSWNRLPSLGLHSPFAPSYGEGRYNFETLRESELFVDRGSKTVVFRPFQQVLMSLPVRRAAGTQIPTLYDDGVTQVDGGNLFSNKLDVYEVPPEYMPRFGRQDIPVFTNTSLANGPYFGVNHLFSDFEDPTNVTRDIVGGTNAGLTLKIVTGASTGLSYGEYDANSYQGRLYTDVNARSTDLNKPLKGIQLPPYLGVARVYGVYTKSDYDTNGSAWLDRGFSPDSGAAKATNLLRTNSKKQTLFIVKDGAEDVIADKDAHTYLISEDCINITLSPDFSSGNTFDDLEYVVEVAVFGFAQGFINRNNYVLSRGKYAGGGAPDSLVSSVRMAIPAAMPSGVQGYSAYLRTVYQGDPFMTRDTSTIQTADYEHRYGQVAVSDAYMVNFPLQQYDSTNSQIPEIPNARPLEVLATADFWTTLGTGKMGGKVFAGTLTDAGFLNSIGTRLPTTNSDNPFQPSPRAFTAGQPENGFYASIGVEIIDNVNVSGTTLKLTRGTSAVSLTEGVDWSAGADLASSARNLAAAINPSSVARNVMGVRAFTQGPTVLLQSVIPGQEGGETRVSISDTSVYRMVSPSSYHGTWSSLTLSGGEDKPVNGARIPSAPTPANVAGMTDRLPLGILVNDSDFIGEDPLRMGVSYEIRSGGGAQSTESVSTFALPDQSPSNRLSGSSGVMGMADGAVLQYTAYNAVSAPDGTRRFRVYRGGGSAYVLSPEHGGGPVDLSAGGFPEGSEPIMKGAVLAGRAYLVRNGREDAFGGTSTRSYGDEIQMVVVTNAVYGEGLSCEQGYVLGGIISPTDYGKGYAAADRYRLEGKPMLKSVAGLPDPNVPLVPYPPEDPADDDPCA